MPFHLRAFSSSGQQTLLPDWQNLTVSSLLSDVGSLNFDYAVDGINAAVLQQQTEVAVFDLDGEVPDTRAVIESSQGSTYSVAGRTYRKFTGRTIWKFLEEGAVYNDGYPNNPGNRVMTQQTPGAILDGALRKAGSLGEIQGLTWAFTPTADSAGNPWFYGIDLEVTLGTPILQLVQTLVDQGVIEMRVVGRELRVYRAGGLGSRLDAASPPTILWAGQSAQEAPETTTSAGIRTVAIVRGENDVIEEVVDATAVARWGRRPVFVSQSGVTDRGTLRVVGRATLDRMTNPRTSRTYRYSVRPGLPRPMRGLIPGDWLLTDMSGALEAMRVFQLSISATSADTEGTVTLTLNDIFLDRDIILERQVKGITGGSTGTGGVPGGTTGGTGGDELDTLKPGQVIGLALSSLPYATKEGNNLAQVTAIWSALTTNEDGSTFDDFDHYDLQWRYSTQTGDDWQTTVSSFANRVSWSPVITQRNLTVRVRAVDHNGNAGLWSDTQAIFTASDKTPPPTPSAPIVTPWLGGARAVWDGKGSAGEAMPGDFGFVEVHLGTSQTFTPSASTLYMTTPVGGVTPLVDLSYDAPTWVRFVAVDLSTPPNKSAPSAAVSVQAERLVEADVAQAAITAQKLADGAATLAKIAPGAIDSTKITNDAVLTKHVAAGQITAQEMLAGTITAASGIIGDAAITSAKIANLAVNNAKIADATIQDAKIANLSVGKLTAGLLSADVTLGARVATALTGQRMEMNSAGLYAWNAAGTQTARIDNNGNVEMLGTFRTGYTNNRQVVISALLSEAGGQGANQAGILFRSSSNTFRFSQIYDTGSEIRVDSPASGNTASTQGTSIRMGLDAVRFIVAGGSENFRVANSGEWFLGNGASNYVSGQTSGSWWLGHPNDQAVYSTGNNLVIRGRGAAGRVQLYVREWFDVYPNFGATGGAAGMYVHGAFGAASKSFIIEHPLDPELKLQHSCTESPTQGVEYTGTVEVGDDGEGLVELPRYFEALTLPEGRTVHLTAVGAPALVGASPVTDGGFTVYAPAGTRVAWLVKASRGVIDVEPPASNYSPDEGTLDERTDHDPAAGA